jgi:hypothetical protein
VTDLLELLGLLMVGVGIYQVAGIGWSLIICGGLVLIAAQLRGWAQRPDSETE